MLIQPQIRCVCNVYFSLYRRLPKVDFDLKLLHYFIKNKELNHFTKDSRKTMSMHCDKWAHNMNQGTLHGFTTSCIELRNKNIRANLHLYLNSLAAISNVLVIGGTIIIFHIQLGFFSPCSKVVIGNEKCTYFISFGDGPCVNVLAWFWSRNCSSLIWMDGLTWGTKSLATKMSAAKIFDS